MPSSNTYKLAKVSAPFKTAPGLFDKKSEDPGKIIAEAILRSPQMPADENGRVRAAVFNATTRDDGLVEGDFAKDGSIDWPHIEQDEVTQKVVLTEAVLAASPYCHFYYDPASQIAAFQSARMNKSLIRMLADWDRLLTTFLNEHGRDVHSVPLQDQASFLTILQNARRVLSVTFYMVPPNGYTRQTVRDTISYISEATEAREIAISIDAAKGKSINANATVVKEMAAECAEGNGIAVAPIVDSTGQFRQISTMNSPIVRQLTDKGIEGVKKLLKWAGDKVNT